MSTPDPVIATIDRGLASLERSVQRAARRCVRFSWLAWGFLAVNLSTGVGLLLILLFFFTTPAGVSSSSLAAGPVALHFTFVAPWTSIVGVFVLPLTIMAFAVREILLGRREAARGPPRPERPAERAETGAAGGWTEAIQRLQQAVSRMQHETRLSLLPLCVGAYILGAFALALPALGGAFGSDGGVVVPFGALLVTLLVLPLYVLARRWVATYQSLLDRQVRELDRVEVEFLWRFTGTPV